MSSKEGRVQRPRSESSLMREDHDLSPRELFSRENRAVSRRKSGNFWDFFHELWVTRNPRNGTVRYPVYWQNRFCTMASLSEEHAEQAVNVFGRILLLHQNHNAHATIVGVWAIMMCCCPRFSILQTKSRNFSKVWSRFSLQAESRTFFNTLNATIRELDVEVLEAANYSPCSNVEEFKSLLRRRVAPLVRNDPFFVHRSPFVSKLLAPSDPPRRLLNVHSLKLVDFTHRDITFPDYAILSHRWSSNEEPNFEEYSRMELRPRWSRAFCPGIKSGYEKILNACEQACNDGIDWLWVDTCCINKGNHDDVVRNIKGMYGYYRDAKICYAFLADVGFRGTEDEIEESDWFRRGWTLQELLAPQEVIFFNKEWKRIGTRSKRTYEISLATGIPEQVIRRKVSLQDVDVIKRLCWSVNRQTTKSEDQAYCLLGILGVSMEPFYGEGVEKAFERLQEVLIQKYPYCRREFDGIGNLYSLLTNWSLTSRIVVDELDFDFDYSSGSDTETE